MSSRGTPALTLSIPEKRIRSDVKVILGSDEIEWQIGTRDDGEEKLTPTRFFYCYL